MLSQSKEALFWAAFIFGLPVGAFLAARFQRVRDIVFFSIVLGTIRTDWLDINFLSREWYRGTTRGIEVSYIDLLILILLFGMLFSAGREGRRLSWPSGMGALLLYFAYSCINVIANDPRIFGFFELTKVARGICVFVTAAYYFRGERELRVFFTALLTAALVQGGDAAYQRYVLHGHRVSGTMPHANALSQYCSMLAPVLLVYAMMTPRNKTRMIYLAGVALAAGGVVLSISRMGNFALPLVLAVALLGSLKLKFTQTNIIIAVMAVLVVIAGGIKASNTLMSRYGEASLEDEYGQDTSGRGVYFRLAKGMVSSHFFGVGLNNWSYWVSENAGEFNMPYVPYPDVDESTDFTGAESHIGIWAQAAPGHNLMALTVGELGWPGLVLLLAIWAQWFYQSVCLLRARGVWWNWFGLAGFTMLLAVFIQNVTEYEFRLTPVFFLTLIMAGSISSALRCARAVRVPAQNPEYGKAANA